MISQAMDVFFLRPVQMHSLLFHVYLLLGSSASLAFMQFTVVLPFIKQTEYNQKHLAKRKSETKSLTYGNEESFEQKRLGAVEVSFMPVILRLEKYMFSMGD